MATSSIFANFDINGKRKAEAFVEALDASSKDKITVRSVPECKSITDKNEIKAFFKKGNGK